MFINHLKPLLGLEPRTPRLEVWCAIRLRHKGWWRLKESNRTFREKHNRAHYQMLSPLIMNIS